MSSIVCPPKAYSSESLKLKSAQSSMVPDLYKIVDISWETGQGDVYTWELESLNGKMMDYKPGQFNMLYVHGAGEVPISISSHHEDGSLIHTTRAVGGVTNKMKNLKTGDTVGVRGPYGTHWPLDEAEGKDVVLLAGGMGLPPLRPVIYHILKHRERFGKLHLLYGVRTPHDIVYKAELEYWHHHKDIEVSITVDQQVGQWEGHVGVVTNLLPSLTVDPNNAIAMMCGPEIMMHFCHHALQTLGFKDEQMVLSMERNMKCAIGHCGHCQWGPSFICKDGPVYYFDQVKDLFKVHEL